MYLELINNILHPMLYSAKEKEVYTSEKNLVHLDSDMNIYAVNKKDLCMEDLMRYKLYRNLVENLFVYFKNKFYFNNRGINPKYTSELNFIANRVRIREKPLDKGEFSREMIGDMLLADKKMLKFALNK